MCGAVQCSAGEARGKATKEGNDTERGFQGSKADSRRAIWHHCNTTSGMVPCSSDAVPPRLWSTMTEMPKVLRVLRFVWPCPALPAMGPVRDAAASWRGATTSVGCHAGPPWTTDVNAPFVALHSRPLMGRGHASCWPPLAPSPKAVSIPSPSCVPSVSCLVSEFHTHSPWYCLLTYLTSGLSWVDTLPRQGRPVADASREAFGCRRGIRYVSGSSPTQPGLPWRCLLTWDP